VAEVAVEGARHRDATALHARTCRKPSFGNPADSGSPVALRPRLATGVLFRGGRPDERGQPRVHVVDASGGYGSRFHPPIGIGYRARRRRDYEQPALTIGIGCGWIIELGSDDRLAVTVEAAEFTYVGVGR
jgi:hypothetical protein